ncbi:hypothetical protein MKX03_021752 [Papaver bracteatum]|nr:hypothetical protein MKX03_021752 [Papaver bracteatum]
MGLIVADNSGTGSAEADDDDEARELLVSDSPIIDAGPLVMQLVENTASVELQLAAVYQREEAMFADGKVPSVEETRSLMAEQRQIVEAHFLKQGRIHGSLVGVLIK